jgi:smad nuclear-interacting protein 1
LILLLLLSSGHPSCSKQHAVIQFRSTAAGSSTSKSDADGKIVKHVKPYLMDLNSSNKTFLNGKSIEDSRFIELRESDVIKFGYSTREYVLVHESVE